MSATELAGRAEQAEPQAAGLCTLVVAFPLRLVRGPGHALFRAESLLNTPLFVGFPDFTSKLWLAHDEDGRYRGLYEWDDPQRAEHYARSLWRVLALGCGNMKMAPSATPCCPGCAAKTSSRTPAWARARRGTMPRTGGV